MDEPIPEMQSGVKGGKARRSEMAGRFEGLSDEQWQMLEPLFPEQPKVRGRGQPAKNRRLVLNSILWILITGSRWCDLPEGEQFAKRSTAHRWMLIPS